jgi:hypothetical protein
MAAVSGKLETAATQNCGHPQGISLTSLRSRPPMDDQILFHRGMHFDCSRACAEPALSSTRQRHPPISEGTGRHGCNARSSEQAMFVFMKRHRTQVLGWHGLAHHWEHPHQRSLISRATLSASQASSGPAQRGT